jgi:hypothetical protein
MLAKSQLSRQKDGVALTMVRKGKVDLVWGRDS